MSPDTNNDITTSKVRVLDACADAADLRFTIGTLVTDWDQHREMKASFEAGGFSGPDCEYVAIDNSGPDNTSAYRGLNVLLDAARGRHVILCHQDVRLVDDDRTALEARLDELTAHDPSWAVVGNGGGVGAGRLALRISDPHQANQRVGQFPARVASLDENFLVVRRSARIGFSNDLSGFHLYGADICLMAELAGHTAYVVDFHLAHLSGGSLGASFTAAEDAFRAKWSRALRPRWVQTTCSLLRISGDRVGAAAGRVAERPYSRLLRKLRRSG